MKKTPPLRLQPFIIATTVPLLMTSALLVLTGCQEPDSNDTTSQVASIGAESTSKVSITIEPSADIPAPPTPVPALTIEPSSTAQPSDWAAEQTSATEENAPFVNIYMVALEDGGKSGKLIGCNDSLIPVQAKYGLAKSESTAKDTLAKLFAVKKQNYGESGLYNALYQSDLKVESLSADANKKATLNLSGTMLLGGVCDNPRFEEQIRETVLQFKDLYASVDIFVNGKPLKELLSGK